MGLGFGRLVLRALNAAEIALAALLTAACAALHPAGLVWALLVAAWTLLVTQVAVLRPRLDRRARAIIAGGRPGPSWRHLLDIGLETVEVPLLVALGVSLAVAALP